MKVSKKFLDKSVTIQSYTESKDSFGQPIKTWGTAISGYVCTIQQVTGNEPIANGVKSYVTTHRMYGDVATITNIMRVLDGSKVYDIVSVYSPFEDHMQVDLEYKGASNGITD